MFETFGEFFWAFMAMSGFMFWICFVAFVVMVIKRKRNKQKDFYEF